MAEDPARPPAARRVHTFDITGDNGAWMRVDAPHPGTPYWSDSTDRRALQFAGLVIGDPRRRDRLELAHADAVRELLLAAFAARHANQHARARELFTRAGRLCTEPLGYWPPDPPRD